MKIAIDIRLLARGGTTGIPGYTRELVNEFIMHHPEHHYTLFYNAFRKTNTLPELWYKQPNVRIVSRRIPNRLLSLTLRILGRPTIETLIGDKNIDVIWSPHLDLVSTTKTPHVMSVHDLSFIHYPQFFAQKYHVWSWLQNQKQRAQMATHLIAVSEFTKNDLIKLLGIKPEKISVVHSGISSEFKVLPNEDEGLRLFKTRTGLEKPFILFFGTLELRKNPIALVRAFTLLKTDPRFTDYQLALAGGAGFGFNEIKKEAQRSAAAKDIRFLGRINDEDRVYLYNLARVFVLPSFFEGFGFPPLEAQACGVPVITSGRTSLQEILGSSALECNPWRPAELAAAITSLETNAELREKMIAAGTQNYKRFNWRQTATATLEILTTAAHNVRR